MFEQAVNTAERLVELKQQLKKLEINDHELKKLNLHISVLTMDGHLKKLTEQNESSLIALKDSALIISNRYIDYEEAGEILASIIFNKPGCENIVENSGSLHFGIINALLLIGYPDVFERTEAYNQFYFMNDMRANGVPIIKGVSMYLEYSN